MFFPKELHEIARAFKNKGYRCFCVGGAIRDLLLGRKVTDYDLATDALPEDVQRLFSRTVPTGIKHGTVTVLTSKKQFEVTTFRTDGRYSDSRKPDYVIFTPSIEEDLERRDFTINAIAYDLMDRKLLDPHSGKSDLKKKTIRAIGDPGERFKEDALRMLRACRFASQLGFVIEARTFEAMRSASKNINLVSAERIRDELVKTVVSSDPVRGLEYMRESGLLAELLPELCDCLGIDQRTLHCFDVYYHSLYTCEAAPENDIILRFSALFHDLGKAKTLRLNDAGEPTFYNHEKVSAELSRAIMKRLRFSANEIEKTAHLIENHMFNYNEKWTDSAVRRFIKRVGTDSVNDLITLRAADQAGACRKKYISGLLLDFKEHIRTVVEANHAVSLAHLAVSGNDIMEHLNIAPGPSIGIILDYLLETVLDDPGQNTRERLLVIARNLYEERIAGPQK